MKYMLLAAWVFVTLPLVLITWIICALLVAGYVGALWVRDAFGRRVVRRRRDHHIRRVLRASRATILAECADIEAAQSHAATWVGQPEERDR